MTVMVLQGDHQEVIQEIDLHQGDLQGMVLHLIEDPTEVVDLVADHLQETMVVQDQGLLMKSIQGEEGTDMRMHMKENEDLRLSRDRLKDIGAEVLCLENLQVTQEPEPQKGILQVILVLVVLHQGNPEDLHQGMTTKEEEKMKDDNTEMEAEAGEEEVEDMIILQEEEEEVTKEEAMMVIANKFSDVCYIKFIFDNLRMGSNCLVSNQQH